MFLLGKDFAVKFENSKVRKYSLHVEHVYFVVLISDKISRGFPPYCSNAFAYGMYMKHNLSNVYIMYTLDLAHEKFDV
jgi:hypothetical protein